MKNSDDIPDRDIPDQRCLRILISRTDSIGDVVLTLPLTGILRERYPSAVIMFLGRSYTLPVAELSENINEFYDWDEIKDLPESDQISFFRMLNADHIIHVFPDKRIATLAKQAGIPVRIGTAHRLFHWGRCNRKIFFSRRRSSLHEAQLNIKLARPLGIKKVPPLSTLQNYYGFNHPNIMPDEIRELLDNSRFNLVIHPGSRGSAREWGLDRYLELTEILPAEKFNIFITGTESEGEEMRDFLKALSPSVHDLTGKLKLQSLAGFLSNADGIVACSTGPLHIAAALGKYAIGIFPPIRPMHPGRWAPLGPNASVIVRNRSCSKCRHSTECECIRSVTADDVKRKLMEVFSA